MNTGDDKKNMKLNMNAQEYKPKSFGQATGSTQVPQNSNVQNPYAFNNMYNQYGGMYSGNMNFVQGQGQYMGQYGGQFTGQYYDPNMMGMNMMDPNMMGMDNFQNPQRVENKPSGGIPGLGGKSKKAATTQSQGTNLINTQTTTKVQPTQNLANTQNKPKEVKKPAQTTTSGTTTKKPTTSTIPAKKEEPSVNEITSKVSAIDIDANELILETDSKEGKMIEIDPIRKPVTIVFIGHVDAGKSTISGSILYLTGQIDERTIDKYKREAKTNNRESWFMAYPALSPQLTVVLYNRRLVQPLLFMGRWLGIQKTF